MVILTRTPNILVLMAVYNGRLWVSQQIDSVLAQEEVNLYIFINDDHSSDGSLELIKKKYGDLPNVKIQSSNINSGSAGKNFYKLFLSANISDYDYVALCDQDDIWLPNKLRDAIDILRRGKLGGYSSAVNVMYEGGATRLMMQSSKNMLSDFLFEGAGQGCTFVLPYFNFLKIKTFIQNNSKLIEYFHFHDWFIYILIRAWNCSWYFDGRPSMLYRQHTSNDIGARGGLHSTIKRFRLIKSGWYKNQIIIASSIYSRAGGNDKNIKKFIINIKKNDSFYRRISMIKFIFLNGRRRIMDRLILILSAAIGWL